MDKGKVVSIFFTGAGTTKDIVARVCEGFGGCDADFDITPHASRVAYEFAPGDIAVIGVPSYGGRVPAPAVEKIAACKGNGAFAVLAVSYGNRDIDDTLIELSDTAESAGFKVVAGGAFVAHHSLMTDVAIDRPDAQDCADIDAFTQAVCEKLASAGDSSAMQTPAFPGNRPYREFGGVPFYPQTIDGCTRCGLCARVCPTNAIPEENPAFTDSERCIACMRCVHACRLKGRAVKGLKYKVAKFMFARKCKTRQGSRTYL
ncbi:MAG: 4Fe-4S binding protein [Slackia sp.]|nr:4Fe-4S binding protein [Slackia sp.]